MSCNLQFSTENDLRPLDIQHCSYQNQTPQVIANAFHYTQPACQLLNQTQDAYPHSKSFKECPYSINETLQQAPFHCPTSLPRISFTQISLVLMLAPIQKILKPRNFKPKPFGINLIVCNISKAAFTLRPHIQSQRLSPQGR